MLIGVRRRSSSWVQMTCSMGPSPRPPYSVGHVRQAHPWSNLSACQSFERRTASGSSPMNGPDGVAPGARGSVWRSRKDARLGAEPRFGRRVVEVHVGILPARARAETAGPGYPAAAGAAAAPGSTPVGTGEAVDQAVAPLGRRPEGEGEVPGAAVEEVAVELPGEARPAEELHHLDARLAARLGGRDPRGARGEREPGVVVRERPGREPAVRAGDLERRVEVRHAVLDGLERADGAAEGVPVEDLLAGEVERALGGAELLEGLQGPRPGRGPGGAGSSRPRLRRRRAVRPGWRRTRSRPRGAKGRSTPPPSGRPLPDPRGRGRAGPESSRARTRARFAAAPSGAPILVPVRAPPAPAVAPGRSPAGRRRAPRRGRGSRSDPRSRSREGSAPSAPRSPRRGSPPPPSPR